MAAITDHILNLDSLIWWGQFILTIIAVSTAVGVPLYRIIKKYSNTLTEADTKMKQISVELTATVESIQNTCSATEALQAAMLSILKIILDDICTRALKRKWITFQDLENMEQIYDAYHRLSGNHGMNARVVKVRALNDIRDRKEE